MFKSGTAQTKVMGYFIGLTLGPAVKASFPGAVTIPHSKPRAILGPTAVLLAAVAFIILALTASQHPYSNADLQIARWVRSLQVPGLDTTLDVMNVLTDAHMAIAFWAVFGAFFVLRGRPLEAIAVFMVSGLWVGDALLSMLVNRPSPSPELVPVVGFSRSASFPSGHISGAVSFYGLLSFLTLKTTRRRRLRLLVPALSVLIIGLASLGRVYASAHWPSDILGSYLFASLGVMAISVLYCRIRDDRPVLPRRSSKEVRRTRSTAENMAHSIASTVHLDPQAGTATKSYEPPLPVRGLYRLAFQAPFPYQHNGDALHAAAAKRQIAGLLTTHWYGRDMVAKVYDVRNGGSSYEFVTEFVPGAAPDSNQEIDRELGDLYSNFQGAGLPTWQIAPGNPHAHSNFIRTPQGELKLIDLESALVCFSYPWQELRGCMRDGNFPLFDDVDFTKLRRYLQQHATELTESLQSAGLKELERAVDRAEGFSQAWKESEPRVWGRLARRLYGLLSLQGPLEGLRRRLQGAEATAAEFVSSAIDRWEQDGQVDRERAAALRQVMSTSEAQTLLKHMGAHLVLTVAIAIPIPGLRSIARFAWTLTFRLKARYALSRGRLAREDYKVARSVHSVPVMLLALVPALGAVSYAASDTIVKRGLGRILLDQSAHKVPGGLYERLGLARITAPRRDDQEATVPASGD